MSNQFVVGNSELGLELAKALNLPKDVKGFTLRIYANEVVTVISECYMRVGSVDEVVKVLHKYNLVDVSVVDEGGDNNG